jgi:hypothetical protein
VNDGALLMKQIYNFTNPRGFSGTGSISFDKKTGDRPGRFIVYNMQSSVGEKPVKIGYYLPDAANELQLKSLAEPVLAGGFRGQPPDTAQNCPKNSISVSWSECRAIVVEGNSSVQV